MSTADKDGVTTIWSWSTWFGLNEDSYRYQGHHGKQWINKVLASYNVKGFFHSHLPNLVQEISLKAQPKGQSHQSKAGILRARNNTIILYLPRLLRELFIQWKKLKRAAVPVSKDRQMQNVYIKKNKKAKTVK